MGSRGAFSIDSRDGVHVLRMQKVDKLGQIMESAVMASEQRMIEVDRIRDPEFRARMNGDRLLVLRDLDDLPEDVVAHIVDGDLVAHLSSRTWPSTRVSGMRSFIRFRQRRNVDLPHPEGPMSAVTYFSGTASDTSKSACVFP